MKRGLEAPRSLAGRRAGQVVLAALWTGFMRVGSQITLFLVPVVTFLLLLGWLSVPLGYSERKWATEQPSETLKRRGLINPDQLPGPGTTPESGPSSTTTAP